METSEAYFARPSHRFLSGDRDHPPISSESSFELTESDIFSSARSNSPEFQKPTPSIRLSKKPSSKRGADSGVRTGDTPSSLPVNIPDWSKILRDEYREHRRRESFDDDDDEMDGEDGFEGGGRIPPHEFLARQMAKTRIASFSVHEGVGRTLKGRDLSRVRNAIWQKMGFED